MGGWWGGGEKVRVEGGGDDGELGIGDGSFGREDLGLVVGWIDFVSSHIGKGSLADIRQAVDKVRGSS
jgi:hypothetical protein